MHKARAIHSTDPDQFCSYLRHHLVISGILQVYAPLQSATPCWHLRRCYSLIVSCLKNVRVSNVINGVLWWYPESRSNMQLKSGFGARGLTSVHFVESSSGATMPCSPMCVLSERLGWVMTRLPALVYNITGENIASYFNSRIMERALTGLFSH
jgi:hypothetical protein